MPGWVTWQVIGVTQMGLLWLLSNPGGVLGLGGRQQNVGLEDVQGSDVDEIDRCGRRRGNEVAFGTGGSTPGKHNELISE